MIEMLYQEPKMEILMFETEGVICTSPGGNYDGGDGNGSDGSGSWATLAVQEGEYGL